ncbi:MAG TPA: permease, partial [Caulobacteraceae bacterium]
IKLVRVDPWLLVACIGASVVGAVVGAPIVVRLPVRVVQGVVGVALLAAVTIFTMTNLGLMPGGGTAVTLPPPLFALAVAAYFVLGALMTCGIGLYAPSLVMFSLLGLDTRAAFPIMMGACAFLMPAGSVGFLRSRRIDMRVVIAIALGGVPAVLLAALVVKSLPLTAIRWGVVLVVLYTAVLLLRSALRPAAPEVAPAPA